MRRPISARTVADRRRRKAWLSVGSKSVEPRERVRDAQDQRKMRIPGRVDFNDASSHFRAPGKALAETGVSRSRHDDYVEIGDVGQGFGELPHAHGEAVPCFRRLNRREENGAQRSHHAPASSRDEYERWPGHCALT